MQRRSLLATIGAVAASGGAIGTGAFTTVEADRDATVSVADDSQGFLSLFPNAQDANGEFASDEDGELQLDFNDEISGQDSTGVGQDSEYEFDAVFGIGNAGTQDPVYVDLTPNPLTISGYTGSNATVDVEFYIDDSGSREIIDGSNAELEIPVGKQRAVGVRVDTVEESEYDNVDVVDTNESAGGDVTIFADDTETTVGGSGIGIDPGSDPDLTKP